MGTKCLCSVQFSSGLVQSIEPPIVWEEQRNSSRSPPAEIPARRPGVCRLGGGIMCFAGCACLIVRDVVWCQSDANSVQNRLQKSSFCSVRLPDRIDCQFVQFSSGHGGQELPFSSFSSVHELFRPCLLLPKYICCFFFLSVPE